MQRMPGLAGFTVGLTSSVHYCVEVVKFLVKKPNFISIKSKNV